MSKKSVLVVEDDVNLLLALRYNLAREDYQVYAASDGESGYEYFKKVNPDLVILDVMLPMMDGLELCQFDPRLILRYRSHYIAAGPYQRSETASGPPPNAPTGVKGRRSQFARMARATERVCAVVHESR